MTTAYAPVPTLGRSECCKAPLLAEVTKSGVLLVRAVGGRKLYHVKCSACGLEYNLRAERAPGEDR